MNDLPLTGVTILNTRPQTQIETSSQSIMQLGGKVINLPTITIEPLAQNLNKVIPVIHSYNVIIFMSANAVRCTLPHISNVNKWCDTALIGAIGTSTAQMLQYYNIKVSLLPTQFNSEGLLAHPQLQQISGTKILIIRGDNGRKLLDNSFCQRGAIVQEVIAYRRNLPRVNGQDYTKRWEQQKIDIILCTSVESMQNLFILLEKNAADQIVNTPWLCISARVAREVRARGIKYIVTAENNDFIQALITWAQQCKESHHG